ncbi:Cys-tRNA(Pro) deacylase [Rothia kristinae]|uniref:Cys-tRNA(Pro)/Cys-tRNA(Cys) deacylase n=1 Tax=Rothia kristinae TaxID=37923 RepID=A0A1S2N2L8_9MICC|nr:Cys-tRNA(Pro) deacylase [Rothia kristinae]MDN5640750.1 Cys-tRNA(Pro) deacylase [Actinomycetes bacterium]OIJ36981.1 aminoacyl-tRNA deacylase [Rothia kristinae]QQC59739.1 Cys-tRNA(Pro) deacylase [Rothia kristinae]
MAKKKQQHGSTAAVRALTEAGVAFTELPYEHEEGAGFGAEAAAKLGRDPDQVYKTLMITHDGQFALGVVPVAGKLDMKAAAAAMGWKSASMADPAVAQKRSGYVVGGISPLGQKTPVTVLLDSGAQAFETVLVSGGKRGFDVELAPADLLSVTGGRYAPIAQG